MKHVEFRPPSIKKRKNAKNPLKRWEPQKWKPEYEEIVAGHCKGTTNVGLAQKFGYTPVQISNILNCTEAQAIKHSYIENLRKESFAVAENKMADLEAVAMNNMHDILTREDLRANAPMAVFDRSFSFLKLIRDMGAPPVNNGAIVQTNSLTVVNNNFAQINESLKLAERARLLNAGVKGESIN